MVPVVLVLILVVPILVVLTLRIIMLIVRVFVFMIMFVIMFVAMLFFIELVVLLVVVFIFVIIVVLAVRIKMMSEGVAADVIDKLFPPDDDSSAGNGGSTANAPPPKPKIYEQYPDSLRDLMPTGEDVGLHFEKPEGPTSSSSTSASTGAGSSRPKATLQVLEPECLQSVTVALKELQRKRWQDGAALGAALLAPAGCAAALQAQRPSLSRVKSWNDDLAGIQDSGAALASGSPGSAGAVSTGTLESVRRVLSNAKLSGHAVQRLIKLGRAAGIGAVPGAADAQAGQGPATVKAAKGAVAAKAGATARGGTELHPAERYLAALLITVPAADKLVDALLFSRTFHSQARGGCASWAFAVASRRTVHPTSGVGSPIACSQRYSPVREPDGSGCAPSVALPLSLSLSHTHT